jgi:hypothetical protein
VLSQGIPAAFFIARQRFADCREAYGALNSIQRNETSPAPQSSVEDNLLLEEAIKCIACDCLPELAVDGCQEGICHALHCGCFGV